MDFDSIDDYQCLIISEQHREVAVLPSLLKLTKTDFGVSLGLPADFPSGKIFERDVVRKGRVVHEPGDREMIRLQDVINVGAWKKHLLRPQVRSLPKGFSIIGLSLSVVATDFTRFFLEYYSPRYRSLPHDSKWTLFNGARACAIWEAVQQKMVLQGRGLNGFAFPCVYDRLVEWRQYYEEFQGLPERVNKATWKQRNQGTEESKAWGKAIAAKMLQDEKDRLTRQLDALIARPLPDLPPLPHGIAPFKLLDEPPAEFMGGVQ